ncbi:MAG: molybdopterin-synthase adenylyltransferase MoeB [Armatimonadetes bacterium]|nr:molybdopterin-synthase adenylyltransferase MoeB [Armatimonadota bacterium]
MSNRQELRGPVGAEENHEGAFPAGVRLGPAEVRRYARHLILPEVGLEGQKKLKAARVLCIGAGGLGAPVSLYLAAAGIGHLTLVDFDAVDATNLQRQILFSAMDVGRPKHEAAKERLTAMNPHVRVETVAERFTSEIALDLVREHDVVVDCTDNFPTRYLSNDACALAGKPNVYGSIFRFDGQASVFYPRAGGPCYRCLFPEPPPPGMVPSCAEGGVLGILPGVIGCLQATECLKLILGVGQPLIGRLLLFNALALQFRELRLPRNPNCPLCGDKPTIHSLIDYEGFCGLRDHAPDPDEGEWDLEAPALKARLDAGDRLVLLDVREPGEWEICHLEGARLIPLGQLPQRVRELDTADEIVLYCHSGKRSLQALRFLRDLGFNRLRNLKGGILAWAQEVDPEMPTY